MRYETIDVKSRSVGNVYVLKPFRADRETVPFQHNLGVRLLLDLDQKYHFTEPEVRRFLDEINKGIYETRVWCNAAWVGNPPPRRTDTWTRVFDVLNQRGFAGATGREVQDITHLGHGAVSGVLCLWDRAGCAYQLATPPPMNGTE